MKVNEEQKGQIGEWYGRAMGKLYILKVGFAGFQNRKKFEFSAERFSENAKTVNYSMCVRKKTKIITNIITN